MAETLKYKKQKARKSHRCDYCYDVIEKATTYINASVLEDGSVYTWKNHIHCEKLVSSLTSFKEYSHEGVNQSLFYEIIREEYDTLATQDETKRTFFEKLDFVLDHYKIRKDQPIAHTANASR